MQKKEEILQKFLVFLNELKIEDFYEKTDIAFIIKEREYTFPAMDEKGTSFQIYFFIYKLAGFLSKKIRYSNGRLIVNSFSLPDLANFLERQVTNNWEIYLSHILKEPDWQFVLLSSLAFQLEQKADFDDSALQTKWAMHVLKSIHPGFNATLLPLLWPY